jgi:Predicted nucleoside-diphosphate-sugar epimerases
MKIALLFGASGLVGSHVLNQLINNDKYSKIKLFVRSKIQINDSKVEIIQIDFNKVEKHKEEIKGTPKDALVYKQNHLIKRI